MLTLRRPLRRKLRMRLFFDISKVKESSFFLIGPHWPPSGTWRVDKTPSLFERMRLKRKRTMFIYTNQPLITSFYLKKVPIFCRISDELALIRNFLRNGRVRVNLEKNVFIQKCGRLRDHPKTSWVADVRNLNVFCEKKRKKAQICKFSCSNGRKLSGSPSVVCERTPEGIFLRDAEERPSCK